MDTCSSVSDDSASAIWPSRPAVNPAPKSMKTAIPFAVLDRTTDPASDSAAITATPAASSSAGTSSGPATSRRRRPVITAAATKTAIT